MARPAILLWTSIMLIMCHVIDYCRKTPCSYASEREYGYPVTGSNAVHALLLLFGEDHALAANQHLLTR